MLEQAVARRETRVDTSMKPRPLSSKHNVQASVSCQWIRSHTSEVFARVWQYCSRPPANGQVEIVAHLGSQRQRRERFVHIQAAAHQRWREKIPRRHGADRRPGWAADRSPDSPPRQFRQARKPVGGTSPRLRSVGSGSLPGTSESWLFTALRNRISVSVAPRSSLPSRAMRERSSSSARWRSAAFAAVDFRQSSCRERSSA